MFITNKNITESLVRSLQNSFTSQTNCEITLMCEGKTLKCHRHVLVLHSTHFSNLFKDQTDCPSTIAVVNMKFSHLKAMVDYMYFGRIKLQEDSDEMNQIIKCAEDLGLSALVTFITEFLKSSSKHKSMNGSSANLSNNDLNGDDVLLKRKRASDVSSRVNQNDSFKKPKLNESLNKTSTPLRDTKTDLKANSNSDIKVSNSDNSETLTHDKNDKKRKSDDDADMDEDKRIKDEEAEKKRKLKEEDERRKKKEEDDRKRKEEQERKRKEEEKQKLEEERRRKAEEDKRKAEEAERIRAEEEKAKKALEKKKEEEAAAAAAKKAEEEKNRKETTKCDESASTKSCAVCNKQYKDNIDHRKVLEGVTFEKKCIISGCSRPLPFRRALIDHLLKAHKIDVCDG